VLISVVTATFNQAGYLREALDSLRRQSLPADAFEAIVINDGSTDDTSNVLKEYAAWAQIIEHENRGLVASCNEGLALACGRYFARLDSDDFVEPTWLAALLEAMESEPAACCAYPDRYELIEGRRRYVGADAANLYSLEACGVLIRTEAVRHVGGFRPFYWEEYDLYLRLRHAGLFLHVPQALYAYRKHSEAMTSVSAKRQQGWLDLAREWGSDTLRSAGVNPELDEALCRFPE